MAQILISWIGKTDLDSVSANSKDKIGPLAAAVRDRKYDRLVLLSNYAPEKNQEYLKWLRKRTSASIEFKPIKLTRPNEYAEIYAAAEQVVREILEKHSSSSPRLTFHISPGTSAMTAIWIILAKTRFQAELIDSSIEEGVRTVNIPFIISADFLPELLKKSDLEYSRLVAGQASEAALFGDIIHKSTIMKRLIERAQLAALHKYPILIEGESGTGKELLAAAIKNYGPRKDKPFNPVNCGSIPSTLVESELFGHMKGAFTDAKDERKGHFRDCHEGTIFLDEIGELPADQQVRILRVLQENKVKPLGSSKEYEIDVRVIAATNRNLNSEVAAGRFREDLYYRLAVLELVIPALRNRKEDIPLIADELMRRINEQSADKLGIEQKSLTATARNYLADYEWPGNVRELNNVLVKAAVWCKTKTIGVEDLRTALDQSGRKGKPEILNRTIVDGFDIEEPIGEVVKHYFQRAMQQTNNSKSLSARLLGFKNYQTFNNWIKDYKVKFD